VQNRKRGIVRMKDIDIVTKIESKSFYRKINRAKLTERERVS